MKPRTKPVPHVDPLLQGSNEVQEKDFFTQQEAVLDSAMGDLFRSLCKTFGRDFIPNKDLARTRTVVSDWAPKLNCVHSDDTLSSSKAYILANFFKRWLTTEESSSGNTRRLSNEAAFKFIEANLDGDTLDLEDHRLKDLLTRMRSIITSRVGEFHIADVYPFCKHGPNGTTTISRENAYMHIKKGDISGTRESLQQFWHYLRGYDTPLREELVETNDSVREFVNTLNIDAVTVECSTLMLFVRKSWKAFRSMCPEMTIPAFFAQGIAHLLTCILKKSFNIDLATQSDVHRDMARLASMFPEIGLATIDWSEASDRIWMLLVEALFPSSWFRFMKYVCRAPLTTIVLKYDRPTRGKLDVEMFEAIKYLNHRNIQYTRTNKDTEIHVLLRTNMFCTMGNPMTFPLQTMIFHTFLTVCTQMAAERKAKDPSFAITPSDVPSPSSFGDDGLVWVYAEEEIRLYAGLLNWKLNPDKSYFDGGFRESCGGDYLYGEDIRPVMLQRPGTDIRKYTQHGNKLIRQSWFYAAANAACELSERMGYDTFFIDRWLEKYHAICEFGKICVVPPYYPEGSGLRVNWEFDWIELQLGSQYPCKDIDECLPLDSATYHRPFYSIGERAYVFRALGNVPWDFVLTKDENFFYYHEKLRGLKPAPLFYKEKGLGLRADRKSVLDSNGNIPDRTLNIKSKVQSVPSWTYWI